MELLLSWVKSGLLFGVFSSIILMLCPNKSYQKHIGLVVGFLFILVILHPLMQIFSLDQNVYTRYLNDFLILESENGKISERNLALYEESVELQLQGVFCEAGYDIRNINVKSDENGTIQKIEISFSGEITDISMVEQYLRRLFGEEVSIEYAY